MGLEKTVGSRPEGSWSCEVLAPKNGNEARVELVFDVEAISCV
jgi:hypothetical protein